MQDKANQLAVVHETVIVPRNDLPPLFLATVSRDDALDPQEELERFLWRAFRTPMTATMSFKNWTRIARALEDKELWEELEHDRWFYWLPHPPNKLWENWRREVRRVRSEISQRMEQNNFATSSLRGVLLQSTMGGVPVMSWRRRSARGITFPLLGAYGSPLAALYVLASLQLDQLNVTVDELEAWIWATDILTRRVPPRLEESMGALLECDIPYSMSPRLGSEPLSRFTQEARFVALFPISSVVLPAMKFLEQGNWVMTIELAVGGAGLSLLIASTFSLVDRILKSAEKRK